MDKKPKTRYITNPGQICYDQIPPKELLHPPIVKTSDGSPGFVRAAGEIKKLWNLAKLWPKNSLKVYFMQPHPKQAEILRCASQWSKYSAINFVKVDEPNYSDIRIAFVKEHGSWSLVGTDSAEEETRYPTMNLGDTDQATVLHEFGHAIGMVHEHQRPKDQLPFELNEKQIIKDLKGPPNYWTEEEIQINVLEKYKQTEIITTAYYDPLSIMHYSFPHEWILGTNFPKGTPVNMELSPLDKEGIGIIYPRNLRAMAMIKTPSQIVPSTPAHSCDDQTLSDKTKVVGLPVFESHKGHLTSGDQLMVKFHTLTSKQRRPYNIVATTNSDISLIIALLGPSNPDSFIRRSDNSKAPEIALMLLPDQDYFVKIMTDSQDGGEFTLSITAV